VEELADKLRAQMQLKKNKSQMLERQISLSRGVACSLIARFNQSLERVAMQNSEQNLQSTARWKTGKVPTYTEMSEHSFCARGGYGTSMVTHHVLRKDKGCTFQVRLHFFRNVSFIRT
jgi:hypothetical protein